MSWFVHEKFFVKHGNLMPKPLTTGSEDPNIEEFRARINIKNIDAVRKMVGADSVLIISRNRQPVDPKQNTTP